MTLNIDIMLLYRLIAVIECHPHWTQNDYAMVLGVSIKTIYNLMERARGEGLGVMLTRVGTKRDGHWVVESLGALNSDAGKKHIMNSCKAFKTQNSRPPPSFP
ncbi:MAG: hypothetical protein RPR28_07755 [Cycloclasticus sp.]